MDRIISDEERIRRAEDVLERRKNTDLRISSETFSSSKSYSKMKIIIFQTVVCIVIYSGIFFVKNSSNTHCQDLIHKIQSILSTDVNFYELYGSIKNKAMEIDNFFVKKDNSDESESDAVSDNGADDVEKKEVIPDETNISEVNEKQNSNIEEIVGIGGANDEIDFKQTNIEELSVQSDLDNIKNKYEFSKPLNEYIVTSEFGARQSSEIVSADHKGIDLGAGIGTSIFSALDGEVIEASEVGDYGTHLKIQTDNVVIVYAHCSKLCVKQGDKVSKGQKIAEVGSTGKATGPHLHFEIRIDSVAINPRLIMEF